MVLCYRSLQQDHLRIGNMPTPAIPNLTGNRTLRLLILCLGIMAASTAQARDYAVEILVFERTEVSKEVEEQWNPGSNSQLANLEKLQSLVDRVDDHPIGAGIAHLAGHQSKLLSSGYRVLHAARWQQPSEVYQNAPVVPVGTLDTRIRGAVRVYRTSLIFVDIALGLTDSLLDPDLPLFFINEKRRVKFKEVHYFDHPRFGALVTVWPVEG